MEISEKRLEANRLNAQKSTGPKTPEGKQKVALNGIKHGIFAKSLLVEGESLSNLMELLHAFYEEFEPRTSAERLYVDKIAAMQWRSTRLWATQSANLSDEIRRQEGETADNDPATRLAYAMRSLHEKGRTQDALSLYEHRFDRQQYYALEALDRLQRRRKAREIPPEQTKPTTPDENRDDNPVLQEEANPL